MSDPHLVKSDVNRLMQEAELYEQQGLFDHAKLVYETILKKEPENRKAQAKVIQVEFSKQAAEKTSEFSETKTNIGHLTPRLALDLGIAYMGMNLYPEALEEFNKALKPSPIFRVEILRYTAVCLIHMAKFGKAESILGQILQDRTTSTLEKSDIISEVVDTYVQVGERERAQKIVKVLYNAEKDLVKDCTYLLSDAPPTEEITEDYESMVEETESGLVYSEPLSDETTEDLKANYEQESVRLNTAINYSRDSKLWKDANSTRISPKWAILELPETVNPGETLILQISLFSKDNNDKVWVIAKIAFKNPIDDGKGTKVDFVSFLPGGEVILRNFIDEIRANSPRESTLTLQASGNDPESIFAALEEEAIKAFEMEMLSDSVDEYDEEKPPEDDTVVEQPQEETVDEDQIDITEGKHERPLKIRFACQCGQVHAVPIRSVGRRGKCGNCGKTMTVPVVDMRPDSHSNSLIGNTVGGCRLLYKLGGGGMGGVFKGHHIALDTPVAVKILHGHLADKDPVFVKRFIREARAAAKLQHPNIVGVMNVGFENNLHFIVMPFVSGGSAAMLLARQGRIRLEKVLHIAIDVARALTVAEEQGMLHRDIKPANILFTPKGDALLADLGLAKNYLDAQDSGITQTGIACGTPLYFSPEQAKGSPNMDIRSDIYSLGITLFHLLEGSPPFKGESAYVIFQKHVHEPLPEFKDAAPPVPDAVFKLLNKMTQKDPRDRYPNAQDLLAALEILRSDLLVSTKPKRKRGLLERLGLRKAKS